MDGGYDPLRKELAADLLLQRAAVISCLRDFEAGFRWPGNAGRRQRGRDRADSRGCKLSDVGSEARPPAAEAVLGANGVQLEMSRRATGLRSSAAMMEWPVAARPSTIHAAADLTGRLDNIFMWQDLRWPAGPNVGVSYSAFGTASANFLS